MRPCSFVCAALVGVALASSAVAQAPSNQDRPLRPVITSPATPRPVTVDSPADVRFDPSYPSVTGRISVTPAPRDATIETTSGNRYRAAPALEVERVPTVRILSPAWHRDRYVHPNFYSTNRYTPTRFRAWRMDDPPIAGYPIGDR